MLIGNRINPSLVLIVGFVSALSSGILAFLMIPPEASIQGTDALGYLQPK